MSTLIRSRIATFFLLALSLALLNGCGQSPEAGAEKAAKQWLDALNAGDLTAAQTLSTEPTAALIQMATAMGQSMAVGKYKISNVTATGDNSAVVMVDAQKDEQDMQLNLVRIDGDWKVGVQK